MSSDGENSHLAQPKKVQLQQDVKTAADYIDWKLVLYTVL